MLFFTFISVISLALAQHNAFDVVAASPDHKTLAKLATSLPDIVAVLKSSSALTLFAPPTDTAFEKLDKATLEAVSKDSKLLATVLSYHVLAGLAFIPDSKTPTRQIVSTAAQLPLVVDFDQKAVTLRYGLGTSSVTGTVKAGSAVVHVVDQVLVPPSSVADVAKAAGLTSLLSSLETTGLTATIVGLKNVTIFAPTNEAFDKTTAFAKANNIELTKDLLAAILKLHVIPSVVYSPAIQAAKTLSVAALEGDVSVKFTEAGKVTINGKGNTAPATVAIADVLVSQGVVHVIDTVLLPDLKNPILSSARTGSLSGFLLVLGLVLVLAI